MNTDPINNNKSILIHIIVSIVVLGLPFLISNTENLTFSMVNFFMIPSLLILILFYSNYYLIIRKYLFPKKYAAFILSNVGLLLGCMFILNSNVYRDIRREHMQQEHIRILKELADDESKKAEYTYLKQRLSERKKERQHLGNGPRKYRHSNMKYMTGFILISVISILTSIGIRSSQHAFNESNKRKRLENEYLKSQNAFLSYQIQPHFFFNTLNSIHALIDISKDQAKQTLIDLSRLMRYVLNATEQDEVSLKKEMDFLKNYCDLMRLRISDEFDFKFEPAFIKPDQVIAPLLLIVLVENAFKHGVSGLDTDYIHISSYSDSKSFTFTVKNSKYDNEVQTSNDSSIGIENLRTRLQLMYPDNKHNLVIVDGKSDYSATLTLNS